MSQRDVPVMLVTVVGGEPLRQAALDAGIIDFIVKPSVRANWCCLRAWRDWQASAKAPTCAQASVFEQASEANTRCWMPASGGIKAP